MKIKILYELLLRDAFNLYKVKYSYVYILFAVDAFLLYGIGMPGLGLSVIVMAVSVLLCGAHPSKTIEEMRQEVKASDNPLKILLFENSIIIFVSILPFIFKIIFY